MIAADATPKQRITMVRLSWALKLGYCPEEMRMSKGQAGKWIRYHLAELEMRRKAKRERN